MKKYTDEDLIEWIRPFKTMKEMREDSLYKYYACRRRGLDIHFPKRLRVERLTISDEELIEWIKTFETITEIRRENINRYYLCMRRGLQEHLPKKRAKKIKEEKEKKEKKPKLRELDSTIASKMYKGEQLENGNIICGRCLEEKTRHINNKNLCKTCYNIYFNFKYHNKDHNKWNIRDEYCHTTIRHHEKTFQIGIKVDERTQNYLTLIGYDFIFKEVYDK